MRCGIGACGKGSDMLLPQTGDQHGLALSTFITFKLLVKLSVIVHHGGKSGRGRGENDLPNQSGQDLP